MQVFLFLFEWTKLGLIVKKISDSDMIRCFLN